MKRYSLADYILSIKPTNTDAFGDTITVGGEGSYLNTITIARDGQLFTTTGYATGGWVHDKNLAKTGTVAITLNQMSDQVAKFKTWAEVYYGGDYEGFTLTLSTNNGENVATCIDCYIQSIPAQTFQANSQSQTWTFTCGKITFGNA